MCLLDKARLLINIFLNIMKVIKLFIFKCYFQNGFKSILSSETFELTISNLDQKYNESKN